jgi:hypothetical protein
MNLLRYSLILAGLAILAGTPAARADEDSIPSFKKKGDTKDEKFFAEVGETIVKAARTKPVKFKMDSLKIEPLKDKPHRRLVHIKMIWYGSVTGTKFTSTIKLDCDATNKEKWELLTIKYDDDNAVPRLGSDARILALVKKFNR